MNYEQNTPKGRVTKSLVLSHRIAMDEIFLKGERVIIFENDIASIHFIRFLCSFLINPFTSKSG